MRLPASVVFWLCLAAPALAQDPEPEPPAEDPAGDDEALPIIKGPEILEYVDAPYPEEAEELGLEATVLLLVELDDTGEVINVDIPEPVGNGFDEAAVDALFQMKFAPAMTEEGPVGVVFEFGYSFELVPEAPKEDAPAPVNVEGTVREMGTRTLLEGVTVVVDGTDIESLTDENGFFQLRGVPVGEPTLKFLHPGHVTMDTELEVVEGEVSSAVFWVRAERYRENEVVAIYQREKEEVTRRTLSIEEVKRIPGTFGDPIKVIQTLPGAARTPFGTGLLIIRGADPEDSGVYIDGIRVPIIYHLTGTTSVLSPEVIESVDFLPGGYGVKYGRTMGGTVNVNTKREFDEQGKLVWGTDILDSQLYFEKQLGKNKQHGLGIGARRSYIDVFIPLVTGDTGFTLKPRYWDYQLKYIPKLGPGRNLDVFVYGFEDILRVATPDSQAQGSDQDTQGDLFTRYLSHRVVARYQHEFSDAVTWEVTPSVGYDGGAFGLGDDFSLTNSTFIAQLRSELAVKPVPEMEMVAGLDALALFYGFDFRSPLRITDIDDPLAEREAVGFDGRGTGFSPDPYLRLNLRPFGDDRWLLSPGVRFSTLITDQKGGVISDTEIPPYFTSTFDPRVLTRFNLFEGFVMKGSTGIYSQPPQPQEAIGVGTQIDTGFEQAHNSSVGFEHQVNQAIQWDVEVFYRNMSRLIIFRDDWSGFGTNPFINAGQGRAYGAELHIRHKPVGRFFGWISYTLSRSERRDRPEDDWVPFDFDQTHIFSAQGGYDLPYDFGVSLQVQYVTGNPTTNFNAGVYDADGDFYNGFRVGDSNGDRLPPFIQTSARVDKLWTFKRWQLETYVDLLNALRGVNPEFTIYNYDYSEFAYVRGLPFIPNIGIEARFFL